MLSIRANLPVFTFKSARQPTPREQKPTTDALQASFSNARDLAEQVHGWYVAARQNLLQAHHCDQQIMRLQGHVGTLERSLGRVSPVLVGVGVPMLGFGEVMHAGVISHGALGLLAAGFVGAATWLGGTLGLKRRIARLSDKCALAHDQTQNYTRLAQALDPNRTPPRALGWAHGLQAPRGTIAPR